MQKGGWSVLILLEKEKGLATAQQEFSLPKHQLITESPTRWGSCHAMIARVPKEEKANSKMFSADRKTRHLAPLWQDIKFLESIHNAHNPLVEFTDALSGEAHVGVSCVKLVLQLFNTEVLKPGEDDTELTKAIKTTITTYLNEKYDDSATDDLLNMASLVDPRFKTRYIQDDKVEAVKSRALAQILSDCQTTSRFTQTSRLGGGRADAAASGPPAKIQKKTLGSFFKKSHSVSTSSLTNKQDVEAELNNYLQAPEVDSETNTLVWWKTHSTS